MMMAGMRGHGIGCRTAELGWWGFISAPVWPTRSSQTAPPCAGPPMPRRVQAPKRCSACRWRSTGRRAAAGTRQSGPRRFAWQAWCWVGHGVPPGPLRRQRWPPELRGSSTKERSLPFVSSCFLRIECFDWQPPSGCRVERTAARERRSVWRCAMRSWLHQATSFSLQTTSRSSCACWPTSAATPSCTRHCPRETRLGGWMCSGFWQKRGSRSATRTSRMRTGR
mmetsp:Transcript_16250/g.51671  ORF Transcript_16250/g.51671 Transcript_16250/m.51671 type:complete len:224 (+) Transcript_16250:803-1474(+)